MTTFAGGVIPLTLNVRTIRIQREMENNLLRNFIHHKYQIPSMIQETIIVVCSCFYTLFL
jgi:hypothetical protein